MKEQNSVKTQTAPYISPDRFMIEMKRLWQQYCPELRFMQFISNFQSWLKNDCFYFEDWFVLCELEEYCETLRRG